MANCNTQQLNITCGTDVVLHDRLIFDGETFDPNLSVGIAANLVSSLGKRTALDVQVVDDELLISVPWVDGTLPGCYGLEVTGSCNSKKWATYADSLIKYTKATRIGASEVTVESDSYDITQEVGYCYSNSPVTFAEVTVDDGYGTPSVDVEYEQRVLSMDFHNLKGNGITDIDVDEQVGDEAENTVTIKTDANQEGTEFKVRNGSRGPVGPKGPQGDSAVYNPDDPEAPDFVMANTTGESTTKAMTQKAVTDELMRISGLPIKTIPANYIVYNAYRVAFGKWQIGMSSQGLGYYINVVKYRGCKVVLTPQDGGHLSLCFTKNIGVNDPDVTEGDYAVIDGTVAAAGDDIIYAGEYTGGMSSEELIVATIPDDCNYLWTFIKNGNDETIKPKSIVFYESKSLQYLLEMMQDVARDVEELEQNSVSSQDITPSYTVTSGLYIRYDGVIAASSNYEYSESIAFNKGDVIILTSRDETGDAIARISRWTEGGQFIETIARGTTTVTTAEYVVKEDVEYIRFCRHNKAGVEWNLKVFRYGYPKAFELLSENIIEEAKEGISELVPSKSNITPSYTVTTGLYIRYDGVIAASGNYEYSELIPLQRGDMITLTSRDGSGNVIARISKWSESGTYIKTIARGTTTVTTASYVVEDEVEYIRFCRHHKAGMEWDLKIERYSYPESYDMLKQETLAAAKDYTNQKISAYKYALCRPICMGDSLTRGAYYGKGDPFSAAESYPYFLGRILGGIHVANAGWSGSFASHYYLHALDNWILTDYDSFIIWFGTNAGLTDTLDTDVEPYEDYNDFAETETGYYCKIICKIKEAVPDAFIVLAKVFTGPNHATTNTVLEKIAEKYGLLIVDNSDLGYTNHAELHCNINNPHFGKTGNLFIANRFAEQIGQYIEDSPIRAEFGVSVDN